MDIDGFLEAFANRNYVDFVTVELSPYQETAAAHEAMAYHEDYGA